TPNQSLTRVIEDSFPRRQCYCRRRLRPQVSEQAEWRGFRTKSWETCPVAQTGRTEGVESAARRFGEDRGHGLLVVQGRADALQLRPAAARGADGVGRCSQRPSTSTLASDAPGRPCLLLPYRQGKSRGRRDARGERSADGSERRRSQGSAGRGRG